MPFRISSAPEIWQRKMHEAIEGLQAACVNLTRNLQKIRLRLSQIPFMDNLLTADGVLTDLNKVRAIRDIPTPTDVKSLKIFLGMITY